MCFLFILDTKILWSYNLLAGKALKYQYRTPISRSIEGDKRVLDVFKCLIPMVLAAIFSFTAAVFFSLGIRKKEDRKATVIGAIFIELISFTVWLPSLNDLFNILGFAENIKTILFMASIALILIGTAVAIVFNLKQET